MSLLDLMSRLNQSMQESQQMVDNRQSAAQAMLSGSMANAGFQPAQQVQAQVPMPVQSSKAPAPSSPGAGAVSSTASPPVSGDLGLFLQAISQQESGGNYGAVGVPTKYGTAYGKYQILDANIEGPGGWDKEALGREISIQQFLSSPKVQETIARSKLSSYFKQYGAEGAAKAWYAGPGNANSTSTSPQYGGPSIQGYADSVLQRMLRMQK